MQKGQQFKERFDKLVSFSLIINCVLYQKPRLCHNLVSKKEYYLHVTAPWPRPAVTRNGQDEALGGPLVHLTPRKQEADYLLVCLAALRYLPVSGLC